jgi:glycosyl transferase family 2
MALRPPGSLPRPAASVELIDEGAAAFARHDVAACRLVFARAGAVEDVHDRYHARVRLMEVGLEAARLVDAVAPARLELDLVLAAAAVEALEDEPSEPVLLNHAAAAFSELWALHSAEALLKAARRLDPALAGVEQNLSDVRRRSRVGGGPPGLPAVVTAELRSWCPRAERVARRAQPAGGLTLSLCMVVRDEEEMLPRCLAAVADAVDEVVVVDTGSADATRKIAASFGARVLDHRSTNSLADARNVSFAAATGDWVMYLDAGEVLAAGHGERLRELTGRTWREAFSLVVTDVPEGGDERAAVVRDALRVFRNRPEYRFEGRLDEQVPASLPAPPERFERSSIRVEHHGAGDRSRRTVAWLERQMVEGTPEGTPGGPTGRPRRAGDRAVKP